MKRLGVSLLHPGWDACPSQGYPPPTPSIKFAITHLYTWVDGRESKVSCPRTEHNVVRARTQSARSGGERTNHEATRPPHPL